ncbi:prepilin-type N-terminal cleavage/methylation domain-containing protein [Naasia sp. SYSU D00057]|uniref:prepilin-type N-terminal cleavage/methylation domain-containing protein n=1 Tax=Naasia sp. SYSU D00057 TaxID=2817380 RepID=UPI001B3054E9|nr:prepilin-type N-terminal cleavage/methylation domain-containing protein [Naasia sp. SYSU D00057]
MSAASRESGDDRGFTLIELIVYMALLALVLGGLGGVFLAGLGAQRDVASSTSASGEAQLVSRSVVQGIRNASSFTAGTRDSAGQVLRARVGSTDGAGTTTWHCAAWFWSAADRAVYTATSVTGPVAAPSASKPAGWTLLASGATLPSGVAAPFTAASSQLAVELLVAGTEGRPVRVSTTAASRPSNTAGTPC